MSEKLESQVREMTQILAQIADGNLSRGLPAPANPDSPLGALVRAVNDVVAAWRAAEIRARSVKKDLHTKLALVENQAASIRELSTPIIEIWSKTLLVPIVGTLAARRADLDAILERIADVQASCVIIDLTGVGLVDTDTAGHLLTIVQAARLLGARCMLTGIGPEVAQTFVTLRADIGDVTTVRNLNQALRIRIVETSGD